MKLYNTIITESLRKYPGSTVLDRFCVQDYCIPGTDGHMVDKERAITLY